MGSRPRPTRVAVDSIDLERMTLQTAPDPTERRSPRPSVPDALCAAKAAACQRTCMALDEPVTYDRFLATLHSQEREHVARLVAHAIETGADYATEYRILLPDGTPRWISDMAECQRSSSAASAIACGSCGQC